MSDQTEYPSSDQPGTDATPPADSTIPESDAGVAAGYTSEPSTFEPEEDVAAGDEDSGDANSGEADARDANTADTDSEPSGTGQRSREAQMMEGDDLSAFQSHWDDFPGHPD